jgi:hypothetical protein
LVVPKAWRSPLGTTFFYIFSLAGIGLLLLDWFAFQHLSGTITDTNSKIEKARKELDDRITQSETRLSDRIDGIISQLAKDLIKQVKTDTLSGKSTKAKKEIALVSELISLSRQNNLKAPTEFFTDTILSLNDIASIPKVPPTIVADLRDIKFQLAEYRSSLNPPPPLPERAETLPRILQGLAVATYKGFTTMVLFPSVSLTSNGAAIDCRGMPPGQEISTVATRSPDQNLVPVSGLIFIGATQTLDYISWENVTFINTHIRYRRGPVRLRNVTFVNCTFDLPSDKQGAQLAEYAALEPQQELKVG